MTSVLVVAVALSPDRRTARSSEAVRKKPYGNLVAIKPRSKKYNLPYLYVKTMVNM